MAHRRLRSSSSLLKRLPVAPEGHLVVDSFAGCVRVQGHPLPQLEVRVEVPSCLPAPIVDIDREAGEVYVEARSVAPLGWVPAWAWRWVRVEVAVPHAYSIEIETRCGSIVVSGLECECPALLGDGLRSIGSSVDFEAIPALKRAQYHRADASFLQRGRRNFSSRVPA